MTQDIAAYPLQALMDIAPRPPLVFVSGTGSWLEDHQGKRYLDFVQGWAVTCLGHSPPQIVAALTQQAARLINPSPAFYNEPALELATLLVANSCFDRVFLASTGAEANEGAIKLARKWGKLHKDGAYEIVTCIDGFHGRTLATMSASGKAGWEDLFEPKVPGFVKARFNDLDAVAALIGPRTVAVMIEPVQGEAGVIPATPAFLHGLRALCDEHQLLLICDEVQTGMGRCGTLFAYQQAGIEPDIMTLGKGLGGGVPLAALLAKEAVCCFAPGDQGGTYAGNPLMAAVGCAVAKTLLTPGFLADVAARGDYLAARLQQLCAEFSLPGQRGRGMLIALQLDGDYGPQLVEAARSLEPEGLLLNAPRANLLRFMPALNIGTAEIDRMAALLGEALRRLKT